MTVAYMEVIDFIASGPTTQNVADFEPSEKAKARVWELVAKKKGPGLTAEESSELNHYLELEHIMRLAKARARGNLAKGA